MEHSIADRLQIGFTRRVFDDAASCSVEVSVDIDISWERKSTRGERNQPRLEAGLYV